MGTKPAAENNSALIDWGNIDMSGIPANVLEQAGIRNGMSQEAIARRIAAVTPHDTEPRMLTAEEFAAKYQRRVPLY